MSDQRDHDDRRPPAQGPGPGGPARPSYGTPPGQGAPQGRPPQAPPPGYGQTPQGPPPGRPAQGPPPQARPPQGPPPGYAPPPPTWNAPPPGYVPPSGGGQPPAWTPAGPPPSGGRGRFWAAVVAGVVVVALLLGGGFLILRGDDDSTAEDDPGTTETTSPDDGASDGGTEEGGGGFFGFLGGDDPEPVAPASPETLEAPDPFGGSEGDTEGVPLAGAEAFTTALERQGLRCFDATDLSIRCYPRLATDDEPSTSVEIDLVDDDSVGSVTVSAYGGTPDTVGPKTVLDLGVDAGADVFDLSRAQVLTTRPKLESDEVDGVTVFWVSENSLQISVPGFYGLTDDDRDAVLPSVEQVRTAAGKAGLRCKSEEGSLSCEARNGAQLSVVSDGKKVQGAYVSLYDVGDVQESLRQALAMLEPTDAVGPRARALVRSAKANTSVVGDVDGVHYEVRLTAYPSYDGGPSVSLSVSLSPVY